MAANIFCRCSGINSFIKNGFDKNNNQRYKCKYCNKSPSLKILKPFYTNVVYKNTIFLTNEELYCLGFLLADGCVKNNKIFMQLHLKDIEILYIIKRVFNLKNKISCGTRKDDRKYCQISFNISYFQDDLYHLGLFPCKTGKETWISYMNSWHFIRGYFDGDGSICVNNQRVCLWSISCQNLLFIQNIFEFIKSNSNITSGKIYTYTSNKSIPTLRFGKKDLLKFAPLLYKDSDNLRLTRKHNQFLDIKNGNY